MTSRIDATEGVRRRPEIKPGCPASASRSHRSPALLLALACVFSCLAPAAVQAQTAYVANNDVRLTNAGYGVSSSSWQAQRFGTGSQASIPLGGIGLTFRQGRTNLTGLVVRIYTVSGGAPGTVVYTLTNPDTLTANTEALFEAPASAELEADTDYFVVVEPTGTFSANWASTSGGAEDSGVTAGWSIADDHYFRAGSGGSWGSSNDALAMAAYPPADATRLVSNLDQSVNNPTTVGSGAGEAQSFATGSHAGGYNLDGVVVKMAGVGAGDTPVVSVYDDNSGVPGTLVHSLTNPSPLPAGSSVADTEFTAAANATLDADSTYWVVIESSAGDFQVGQTTSHAEDSGKAAGWSVGDTKLWRTSSQTWDDSTSDTTVLKIAVKGSEASASVDADATLSGLTLEDSSDDSTVDLSPAFASGTTSYAASVANEVDQITVEATANDSNASVEYLDGNDAALTDADDTKAGFQVDLGLGNTVIKAKVTAGDDSNTRTYRVTVTRELPGRTLVGNFVDDPTFNPETTDRSEQVAQRFNTGMNPAGYTLTSVEVGYRDAQGDSVSAKVCTVTGADQPTDNCEPLTAPSTFTLGVIVFTAPDGIPLADQTKYAVVLTPGAGSTVSYEVNKEDTEDSDSLSDWNIAGEYRYLSGGTWQAAAGLIPPSIKIRLKGSVNTVSNDATLSDLTLEDASDDSAVDLSPAFASGTTSYAASVAKAVDRVTVEATANDSNASVEYLDGIDAALTDADDAKAGFQVDLAVGENVIKAKVTAEDDSATETYQVTVTRELETTLVSNFVDDPTFNPETTDRSEQVAQRFNTGMNPAGYTLTSVEVGYRDGQGDSVSAKVCTVMGADQPTDNCEPLTAPSTFTLGVIVFTAPDGIPLLAQTKYAVVLTPGAGSTVSYEVNKEDTEDSDSLSDWNIAGEYRYLSGGTWQAAAGLIPPSIKIRLKGSVNTVSNDATLSDLTLEDASDDSAVDLSPAFASGTTSYAASVAEAVDRVTVEATANDSNASVEYLDENDTALADADDAKAGFQVDLAEGENVIKAKVTAEDDSITETYQVTVTRADPIFGDLVSNLDQSVNNPTTVGSGAGEAQSFATGSHAGGYNLDGVVVKMAGVGAGDTPVVSVYDDNSGVPGTLVHSLTNPSPLPSGSSVADTEFTAAANATLDADSTYWVVIESSAGDFQVGQTTSHAEDSGKAAGWSVGDMKRWRTSSETWDDSTSDSTVLKIAVSGSEASTSASTSATLSDLTLENASDDSSITLNPVFVATTTSYTASVANAVDQVTVEATANDGNAGVEYLDASDAALADADDTKAGFQVDLDVGDTVIKAKVTAEDGSATETYQVTVTRAARQAQTTVKLVGNFNSPHSSDYLESGQFAQRFETGSNPAGYTLQSVEFTYRDSHGDAVSAKVCTIASGHTPTSTCTNLTAPASFVSGNITFTADGGMSLEPDTRYTLVLNAANNSVTFRPSLTNREDSDSLSDWNIVGQYSSIVSGAWQSSGDPVGLGIVLRGLVNPHDADATLSDLTLEDASDDLAITISPSFVLTTTSYTASVANAVDRVTVEATANDSEASVEYLDENDAALTDADATKAGFQVDLDVGDTVIKAKVTAEDDSTTETYQVTVAREPPGTTLVGNLLVADDADTVEQDRSEQVAQRFDTGTHAAGYTLTSVEVDYRDAQGDSVSAKVCTVMGDDQPTDDCEELDARSTFTRGVVLFTALDGIQLAAQTKYAVVLTPGAGLTVSYRAHSVNLEDAGGLSDWNIAGEYRYLNGGTWQPQAQGLVLMIRLKGSVNTASNDATLSDLTLEDASDDSAMDISPTFASTTTSYTASVANDVDQVTVEATVNDSNASVEYLDASDAALTDADDTKAGFQVDLDVGENVIKAKVTAEDDSATETYQVTVTRAAPTPSAATLISNHSLTGNNLGLDETQFRTTLQSQAFRTGSNSGGYTLSTAEAYLQFGSSHSLSNLSVSIWSDSSGTPAAQTVQLENPAAAPGATALELVTFTAPADTVLDADTTYHIVFRNNASSGTMRLGVVESNDEEAGGAAGWSIDNGKRSRDRNNASAAWTSVASDSVRIRITGMVGTATANTAATGAPSVTGPPQVGKTLGVDTGGIVDADGNAKAENGDAGFAYSYQWYRVDASADPPTETLISGATAATYTPGAADVGHRLKVQVEFTDDADNAEGPLASAAHPARGSVIAAARACASDALWCGTVTVEEWLPDSGDRVLGYCDPATGSGVCGAPGRGGISDDDFVLDGATYTIESLRWAVPGARNEPESLHLTLDADLSDAQRAVLVLKVDTHEFGLWDAAMGNLQTGFFSIDNNLAWRDLPRALEELTAGAELTAELLRTASTEARGKPGISGTPEVGKVLTADMGGIVDADGLARADAGDTGYAYSYQWVRVDGGVETDIAGATAAAYTLTSADEGGTIRVRASFTDDADNAEGPLTSDAYPPTGAVAPAPNMAEPFGILLLDIASVPDTLESTGEVGVAGGGARWSKSQRFRTGANAGGYSLSSAGVDILQGFDATEDAVRVSIHSSASDGSPGQLLHVLGNPAAISGLTHFRAPAGATLDADTEYHVVVEAPTGGFSIRRFAHSADESNSAAGWSGGDGFWNRTLDSGPWSEETESKLRLEVRGAYVGGANMPATGKPGIAGGRAVGATLRTLKGSLGDPNGETKADAGETGFAYTHQWVRVDGMDETDIAGATSRTYTPVPGDEGKTLKVRVGFTDDDGNAEGPFESDPTGAIVAKLPEPSCTPGALWCATVFVGSSSRYNHIGYCGRALWRCDAPYGALGDDGFTLGGADFVVESLRWAGPDSSGDNLHLTLDRDFASGDLADLILVVDGRKYALSSAGRSHEDVEFPNNYRWGGLPAALEGLPDGSTLTAELRRVSTDATLSGLALADAADDSSIALAPAFARTTTDYTASVGNDLSRVTIEATANDNFATVEYQDANGVALTDADSAKNGFQAALGVGANVIKVKVTAEDPAVTETYRVTVTRALPPGCTDPLAIWCATLTVGEFGVLGQFLEIGYALDENLPEASYGAISDNEFDYDGVTYVVQNLRTDFDNSDLTLDLDPSGKMVFDGSAFTLHIGTEEFSFGDAGGTSTFLWSSSGLSWSNGDTVKVKLVAATLSGLALEDPNGNAVTLSPVFAPLTTDYTATVASDVDRVTVTPTTVAGNATVTYLDADGAELADADPGASGFQAALDEGENVVQVKVMGDNTQTFRLTVSRAVSLVRACASDALWCATVTVEEWLPDSGDRVLGYCDPATGSGVCGAPGRGGISDDDFVLDGATYTIESLRWAVPGARNEPESLHLTLDADLSDAQRAVLVLKVDTHEFGLWDAAMGNLQTGFFSIDNNLAWRDLPRALEELTAGAELTAELLRTAGTEARGKPGISGTPEVGKVLTADMGGIVDADGLARADAGDTGYAYSYQWVRVDGGVETDIAGATAAAYTLTSADEGGTIRVRASFTDDADNAEGPLTSDAYPPTGAVAPAPNMAEPFGILLLDIASVPGTLESTGLVGVAGGGARWSKSQRFRTGANAGGYSLSSVGVDILQGFDATEDAVRVSIHSSASDGSPGQLLHVLGNPAAISGLTHFRAPAGATLDADTEYHVVVEAPAGGFSIRRLAHSADESNSAAGWSGGDGYWNRTLDSGPWSEETESKLRLEVRGAYVGGANMPATGKPGIAGGRAVGATLRTLKGSLGDPNGETKADAGETGFAYTHQWVRVDGMDETDIAGATSRTYTPVPGDEGKTLKVRVGFTDDDGNAEGPFESDPTGAIVAKLPEPSCTPGALWCATVFVGSSSRYNHIGYCGRALWRCDAPYGALGDDGFTLGGADFVVESLRWAGPDSSGDNLHLTLDRDFASGDLADLILVVDGRKYALSSAGRSHEDVEFPNNYRWGGLPAALEGLPDGSTLTAELRRVSTDATLSGLTLGGPTGTDISLTPAFVPDTTSYAASVAGTVTQVTIEATTSHSGATVRYFHGSDAELTDADPAAGFQIDLGGGANVINIEVTAEDTTTTETYEVTVTRQGATGAPSVTGPPQVGKTLGVDTGGIVDADGNAKAENGDAGFAYSYQWYRVDASADPPTETPIAGATAATYTPGAADVGHRLKVQVEFTDDADNAEGPLASAPHPARGSVVAAARACASDALWCATVTVEEWFAYGGDVLGYCDPATGSQVCNASVRGGISDDDFVLDGATYTIESLRWAVPGGRLEPESLHLTLDADLSDAQRAVLVLKVDTHEFGLWDAAMGNLHTGFFSIDNNLVWRDLPRALEELTSGVEVTAELLRTAGTEARGKPGISGTPEVGKVLTADMGGIVDADGLARADAGDTGYAYGYQWVRVDGGVETAIAGATAAAYTLTSADEGKTIRVRASFTDDADNAEGPLTSDAYPPTGAVAAAPNMAEPFGTLLLGIASSDMSFDSEGDVGVAGGGARWSKSQRFRTGANAGGYSLSSVGLHILNFDGAKDAARVSIHSSASDGSPGQLLHLLGSPASISDSGLTYFRAPADATLDAGTEYHVVVEAPAGSFDITTLSTFHDVSNSAAGWGSSGSGYWDRTLHSAPWYETTDSRIRLEVRGAYVGGANMPATGKPGISGGRQVGETLRAVKGTLGDPNGETKADAGETGFAYTYQWVRVDGMDETDIAGATSGTYTLAPADEGKTLKVRVGFTDDDGNAEGPLTSDPWPASGSILAAPSSCTPGAPWCATLTVGFDLQGEAKGYCDSSAGRCVVPYGALSDIDFTLGGTDYIVESIRWAGPDSDGDNLHLTLDRDFAPGDLADLTLAVGGHAFALSDASRGNTNNNVSNNYRWGGRPAALEGLPDGSALTVELLRASTDVSLSGLALEDPEGRAVTLAPAFDRTVTAYAASVASGVGQLTIGATANNGGAAVEYQDGQGAALTDADDTETGFQVDLDVGANVIRIEVTASDDSTTLIYEVTVTRGPSGDATLSGLALRDASDDTLIEIDPSFVAATTSYAATVARAVEAVTVEPATVESGAGVDYIDGNDAAIADADDGKAGQQVALAVGSNTIKVRVTAPDGVTMETYTLAVTRLANFPATGAPSISGAPQEGRTLTAGAGDIADADGLPSSAFPAGYSFQWLRVDDSQTPVQETPVARATARTYTPVAADVGKRVKVRVSFTDGAGESEARDSDAFPSSGSILAQGANSPPAFADPSHVRTLAETVGAAAAQAAAVLGAPITATDADQDPIAYSLEGTGASKFAVDSSTGQLSTKAGERYDHEETAMYSLSLKAEDDKGGSSMTAVRIDVTDNTGERPLKPDPPAVQATAGSFTSLDVSWTAPDNTGRPPIAGYDLRYRVAGGAWSDGPRDVPGTAASIAGLAEDTAYEAQVRAGNADGEGPWSDAGSGRTGVPGAVSVSFGSERYTAREGGGTAGVTLRLSEARDRTIVIPLVVERRGGASAADHSAVPASVTFGPNETAASFEVAATDDEEDDDGESLRLSFGTLPSKVTAGTPAMAAVRLADNDGEDAAAITIRFDAESTFVREGLGAATVGAVLNQPPGEPLDIPLVLTRGGGAGGADHSAVPGVLIFAADKTRAEFVVTATGDGVDDDGEYLEFAFGTLPAGVSRAEPSTARVNLVDEQGGEILVSFAAWEAGQAEGNGVRVTLTLSEPAPSEVTIPLVAGHRGGAGAADYAGLPSSVTFAAGESSADFEIDILADDEDDDGESLVVSLGALPAGYAVGYRHRVVVALRDADGRREWRVWFGKAEYTAAEGAGPVTVEVELDAPWKPWLNEPLVLGIGAEHLGGASSADHTALPARVTVPRGETSAELTVSAVDDALDDDGESIRLSFANPFPDDLVVHGGPGSAVVHLQDNDGVVEVEVAFDKSVYTAAEGGSDARVAVRLDRAPGRQVEIPLVVAHRGGATADDHSGVPDRLVFGAGDTEQAFSVVATDDSNSEYEERLELRLGTLPEGVEAGSPARASVNIRDDDGAPVPRSVYFGGRGDPTSRVEEGGGFFIDVYAEPPVEGSLSVPVRVVPLGGISGSDYAGMPEVVTFSDGGRRSGFVVDALEDAEVDPGEGLRFEFDGLPEGLSVPGGRSRSRTLMIVDNDGPAKLSVSDASAREPPNGHSRTHLVFEVSLDRGHAEEVRVDYRTEDGTAVAPADYVSRSGTLVFAPWETLRRVGVSVGDDEHDEGTETMALRLSNAVNAEIADGTGEGRIRNTDAMPGGWLSRFGRAASTHVLEAVEGRLEGARPANHLTVGGRRVDAGVLEGWIARVEAPRPWARWPGAGGGAGGRMGGGPAVPAAAPMGGAPGDRERAAPGVAGHIGGGAPRGGRGPGCASPADTPDEGPGGSAGAEGGVAAGAGGPPGMDGPPGMGSPSGVFGGGACGGGMSGGGMSGGVAEAVAAVRAALGIPARVGIGLAGSSFDYSPGGGGDGWLSNWSAWGRTSATRFEGADGRVRVGGAVETASIGVDAERGRWLAGVALSRSRGSGSYRGGSGGKLSSELTSLNPFARFAVGAGTSLWGTVGYGVGDMTLTPERSGEAMRSGLSSRMAALGGRGVLASRGDGDGQFRLAVRSDALWTSTESEAVGGLAGAAGTTTRVRVLLEAGGSLPAWPGGVLSPRLEAGLRHDGGDAETGAGVEAGAGLGYRLGRLSVQLDARALLAHEDSEYREWGLGGSVGYAAGAGGRGLSLSLGSALGATHSGVRGMWARETAEGIARGGLTGPAGAGRHRAELAYVFGRDPEGPRWRPFLGVEAANGGSSLSAGLGLEAGPETGARLEFTRRDGGLGDAEYALQLSGRMRW